MPRSRAVHAVTVGARANAAVESLPHLLAMVARPWIAITGNRVELASGRATAFAVPQPLGPTLHLSGESPTHLIAFNVSNNVVALSAKHVARVLVLHVGYRRSVSVTVGGNDVRVAGVCTDASAPPDFDMYAFHITGDAVRGLPPARRDVVFLRNRFAASLILRDRWFVGFVRINGTMLSTFDAADTAVDIASRSEIGEDVNFQLLHLEAAVILERTLIRRTNLVCTDAYAAAERLRGLACYIVA